MRRTLVPRMEPYVSSIFGEMSTLAAQTGAVNLGQGFPDTDGPHEIKEIARAAIADGRGNQYPPVHGLPDLREAIAEHQQRFYGLTLDPGTDVVVTTGASEAIQSSLLALCDQHDEVLVFEPWFDIYAVGIDLSRAHRVSVPTGYRCPARRHHRSHPTPSAQLTTQSDRGRLHPRGVAGDRRPRD